MRAVGMDGLTAVEAEVLGRLRAGERRSAIARARGVSNARITIICQQLREKGFEVPTPARYESPNLARALQLYQQGLADEAVAEQLGVSRSWAWQMRSKLEERGALSRFRRSAWG